VRVNAERAKSGHRVVPGDTIELVKNQLRYRLNVLSLPSRRGTASEMAECYAEDAASQHERQERMSQLKEDRKQMPRTRGKPDKHTRRMLRERNRG
jgi:ribosome-associated heat shock protein Hsp15